MTRLASLLIVILLFVAPAVSHLQAAEPETKPDSDVVRVAIFDYVDKESTGPRNLKRILTPEHGFSCQIVSAEQIRGGELKNYDVLIMPGGSGGGQARNLKPEGREAVRTYVKNGGGYVGICAGAYLASSHYKWSLSLINARVWDRSHWKRGQKKVDIQLTPSGQQVLSKNRDRYSIYYSNGPLLVPDNQPDLPGYEVLARFETEVAENGAPAEAMVGTHAIIRSKFGTGRVICFSPHAEVKNGPHSLIASGIYWAANPK